MIWDTDEESKMKKKSSYVKSEAENIWLHINNIIKWDDGEDDMKF